MEEYEVTLEGFQLVTTVVTVKANSSENAESRAMDKRNWLDDDIDWEKRKDEDVIDLNPIDVN
tara:strand:- start:452 stop:640 length:189 start_codon:yes stop_codon:yes gene_type:complete